MTKLWGGRFRAAADATFAQFNASLPCDGRMIEADIIGSQAWARALQQAGILTLSECQQIITALGAIQSDCQTETDWLERAIAAGHEDVHAYVEAQLYQKIGHLAGKLHTGRSRNDQVATDLRLYLKAVVSHLRATLLNLRKALVEKAELCGDHALPGYTHLQRAQPILWGHYFLSFYEMLKRDDQRFADLTKRLDTCPLGSGALAGTAYAIDREALAADLGFAKISRNSLDATSDRDFAIELVQAAALTMVHLSRLAEDLIIYATEEFGFVVMSDAYATGSSLMPQKKNPDALELVRGKTARVIGHQTALLSLMKGLPSCYNKDLQEDKEAVFDSCDNLAASLEVMRGVISTMTLCFAHTDLQAERGFLAATDLADHLVRQGVPFREAHGVIGQLVLAAIESKRELSQLSEEELLSAHPLLAGARAAIKLKHVLEARQAIGGTAPLQVRRAIAAARIELQQ